MEYRFVDAAKAQEVAKLAVCLTSEIMERTGAKHFDVDVALAARLCSSYLGGDQYRVMAAIDQDTIVGFGSVCESRSLYAEGLFGIIQEFYVLPDYRSRNIGRQLIERIMEHARSRGWKRLELCTPPLPAFDRTVSFYQSNGFQRTGGFKMKCAVA